MNIKVPDRNSEEYRNGCLAVMEALMIGMSPKAKAVFIQEALQVIRDKANGIHPPVLQQ